MSGALEKIIAIIRSFITPPQEKIDDSVNLFYRIPNLEDLKGEELDEVTLAESAGFAVRRLVEA